MSVFDRLASALAAWPLGACGALAARCPLCGRAGYLHLAPTPSDHGTTVLDVSCVSGAHDADALAAALGLRGFTRAPHDPATARIAYDGPPLDAALNLGPAPRFRLLSFADLRALPPPAPLVVDTLDLRTLVVLAGAPGSGKSFVAVDLAASVATGEPWHGRQVAAPGPVLYVAGEGAHGIGQRVAAWAAEHNRDDVPGLCVLDGAPQLLDPGDVAALAETAADLGAALVVVDTLSRALVGADENSAQGMGAAVAALDVVRRASGSGSVLAIHHTGKGGTIRGSSALEGAADAVYLAWGDETTSRTTIDRTKRKDGPTDDRLTFERVPLGGSLVLRRAESRRVVPDEPRDTLETTFGALWDAYDERLTFTRAEARRVFAEAGLGLQERTANRRLAALIERGALAEVSTGQVRQAFRCSRDGARALGYAIREFALATPTGADLGALPDPD